MGCLLWHHCLIAIHRLMVVVYPNLIRRISIKTYAIVGIVVTRLSAIIVCIPTFLTDSIEISSSALRCSMKNRLQIVLNLTLLILLPNLIIIVCFLGIFFHVRRATNLSGRRNTNALSAAHALRREIRITKMFAVLFILFFLGYHPYGFSRFFNRRQQIHPDVFVLLTLLYCISICASPLVYGIMNNQLRHECMRVLFNCWHCQPIDDYANYSHHRLNSTTINPLTTVNEDEGTRRRNSTIRLAKRRKFQQKRIHGKILQTANL